MEILAMNIATIAAAGALAVIMAVRAVIGSKDTKKEKTNKERNNKWIH